VNFAIGTSLGALFFGSLKVDVQGKPKLVIGKVENFAKA